MMFGMKLLSTTDTWNIIGLDILNAIFFPIDIYTYKYNRGTE